MNHWFVSRHVGALAWARTQGIEATVVAHLDPARVAAGDIVIGTLPVHLAADVCARGARYLHLALDLPERLRGVELSAQQMAQCSPRLVEYRVEEIRP